MQNTMPPAQGLARPQRMMPGTGPINYQRLQAGSHLPEVQAAIRRLLVRHVVRVAPWPGDPSRVWVFPAGD